MYIKPKRRLGETSKKPVGPCILSPRGGYPRDIEGHRGSSRVLVLAQEKLCGLLNLFLSNEVGKSRMTIREDIS